MIHKLAYQSPTQSYIDLHYQQSERIEHNRNVILIQVTIYGRKEEFRFSDEQLRTKIKTNRWKKTRLLSQC